MKKKSIGPTIAGVFFAAVILFWIGWALIYVAAYGPAAVFSPGASDKELLSYNGYLIGAGLELSVENIMEDQDDGDGALTIGMDIPMDKLQPKIIWRQEIRSMTCLGQWPDGTDRYLIRTKNQDGCSYVELYDLRKKYSANGLFGLFADRSDHCYVLRNGAVTVGGDNGQFGILFPAILRTEHISETDVDQQVFGGITNERAFGLYLPDGGKDEIFDFIVKFYEEAALYEVESAADDVIVVSFSEAGLAANEVTEPKQLESPVPPYRGTFEIKIEEPEELGCTACVTLPEGNGPQYESERMYQK